MKFGLFAMLIALVLLYPHRKMVSGDSGLRELEELSFEESVGPAGQSGFKLPPNAFKVRENLYFLGTHDYKGEEVEGYAIIRKRQTKTPHSISPYTDTRTTIALTKEPQFELFSRHVRWYWSEGVLINPLSRQNFDTDKTVELFTGALKQWEEAAGYPLVGKKPITVTKKRLEADLHGPDELNEVYFTSIQGRDIEAVTVVWGVFTGEPETHKLVAWDQVYDDVNFIWDMAESSVSLRAPDLQEFGKVAAEELGFAFGMRTIDGSESVQEVLYGFAD